MTYNLTAAVPLLVAICLLALVGGIVSLAVIAQTVARHHRARLRRHESIPTYYRRMVLAR